MSELKNIASDIATDQRSKLTVVAKWASDYSSISDSARPYSIPAPEELIDFAAKLENITKREFQVFEQVLCGLTAVKIGKVLGISPRTVDVHKARLMKKMELSNMVIAARYFGILEALLIVHDRSMPQITFAKTG